MVFCLSDSKTCPTGRLEGPNSLIRTLSPNRPGQIAFDAREFENVKVTKCHNEMVKRASIKEPSGKLNRKMDAPI